MDFNVQKKEILDELETLGITVNVDNKKIDVNKNNYRKISPEQFAMFDSVMKVIPTVLHHEVTKEAYQVIFDKGLGVLQKAKGFNGEYYRANVVNIGRNNKVVGQALLKPLDKSLQFVSSAFTVMSIITGQYYMDTINKEIKSINEKLNDIQSFLSEDKKTKLLSEGEFLETIQNNLEFILDDDVYRNSTLTTIQKISIDSLASLKFYSNQINVLQFDKEKVKIEEIMEWIVKIGNLMSDYLYTLYLFSYSIFLEVILSKNLDEKYFQYMENRIEKVYIEYKENSSNWLKKWNDLIKKSKVFSENKILKYIKDMPVPFYPVNIPAILLMAGVKVGAGVLYQKDISDKNFNLKDKQKKLEDIFFKNEDFSLNIKNNIELY
ncbi:hypothetical protein, partial [uncultured Fusobacterium sp.]|uniref:hypothetical protein n=1 Tax=uncultured Fusobacterium sp. TaxID=159267 RepID=UPI0015A59D97